MFNPNLLPRNPRQRNNRQSGSLFETVRTFLLAQNPFWLFSAGIAILSLLVQAMPTVLAAVYTAAALLSLASWTILDFAFGARMVAEFPALMWMVWGAVIGACSAFWLSAPLYGWRNKRALIILLPVILMLVSGLVISFKMPLPPQPRLLDTPIITPPTVTPDPTAPRVAISWQN